MKKKIEKRAINGNYIGALLAKEFGYSEQSAKSMLNYGINGDKKAQYAKEGFYQRAGELMIQEAQKEASNLLKNLQK